jgi:DNA polymerase-3 subunit gamma/tau
MEQFVVSARKYRPTTFEDVVGQKHVAETLMHEINNNKLAQAFLFTGPRGVGKTTCARILAKVINTQENSDPDQDFAFNIFEMDAASNSGVEDIRNLIEQVRIPPQVGRYKVYIIDEVHMLSQAAFNAFLKTLEEPPSYAIFILATTEKHKILPTILSRCQVFHFNRIETIDMVNHLKGIAEKEGIFADEDSLHLISRKADGGLRDALSMFDQLVSFGGGKIVYETAVEILSVLDTDVFFELVNDLLDNNIANTLLMYDKVIRKGFDGSIFIGGLANHCRNLAVSKDAKTENLLDVSATFRQKYLDQSKRCTFSFILNALNLVNEADEKYRNSRNPRLMVELLLMKLANLNALIAVAPAWDELKKKINQPGVGHNSGVNSVPPRTANDRLQAVIIEEKDTKVPELPKIQTKANEVLGGKLSSFEAFKQQKLAEKEIKSIGSKNKTDVAGTENSQSVNSLVANNNNAQSLEKIAPTPRELNNTEDSVNQQLSDSPPLNVSSVESALQLDTQDSNYYNQTETLVKITSDQLNQAIQQFIATQGTRVSSALRLLSYSITTEGSLKIILGSKAQEGLIEEVRAALIQSLNKSLPIKISGLETELAELENTERRPYTDREKLDYLTKKHPLLAKTIEDLQLRIP